MTGKPYHLDLPLFVHVYREHSWANEGFTWEDILCPGQESVDDSRWKLSILSAGSFEYGIKDDITDAAGTLVRIIFSITVDQYTTIVFSQQLQRAWFGDAPG